MVRGNRIWALLWNEFAIAGWKGSGWKDERVESGTGDNLEVSGHWSEGKVCVPLKCWKRGVLSFTVLLIMVPKIHEIDRERRDRRESCGDGDLRGINDH